MCCFVDSAALVLYCYTISSWVFSIICVINLGCPSLTKPVRLIVFVYKQLYMITCVCVYQTWSGNLQDRDCFWSSSYSSYIHFTGSSSSMATVQVRHSTSGMVSGSPSTVAIWLHSWMQKLWGNPKQKEKMSSKCIKSISEKENCINMHQFVVTNQDFLFDFESHPHPTKNGQAWRTVSSSSSYGTTFETSNQKSPVFPWFPRCPPKSWIRDSEMPRAEAHCRSRIPGWLPQWQTWLHPSNSNWRVRHCF